MIQAAFLVVVTFSLFLLAFTGVVFLKPATAERFLAQFASSAKTHYLEQAIRILVGAAVVVLSPAMWQSTLFRLVGWAIVISSVVLMCAPWQWHHRFGQRIRPVFTRYLKLYALGAFAFGALLLYGVFTGGRAT
jgi:hypothetical protein